MYNRIFTISILFATIFVLYCIWQWKCQDRHEKEGMSLLLTGESIASIPAIKIENLTDPTMVILPLKELIVKASYNTAVLNGTCSTTTMQAVLARGVRFIDFEIYYDEQSNTTYVGSNKDVKLADMLQAVVSNAFIALTSASVTAGSAPSTPPTVTGCPNPGDPLFIQLRIFPGKEPATNPIYNLVGMALQQYCATLLYKGTITGQKTLFQDVMGKIIIVCDQSINPKYLESSNYAPICSTDISNNNCYSLANYVNVQSWSLSGLRTITYSHLKGTATNPPTLDSSNNLLHTSATQWWLVEPDMNDNSNQSFSELITSYGCQIIAQMFNKGDINLGRYEVFFNKNKSAFVPIANALT